MNNELGQKVVESARSWKFTPWVHQGRLKGQGVDCAGLIVGVAHEVRMGLDEQEASELGQELAIPNNYKRRENGEDLIRLLEQFTEPVDRSNAQPGDVIALIEPALREPNVPRHLGFLTQVEPNWYIIHASARGVVEHRMDMAWKKRVHSVWRLRPEVIKW